MPQPANLPRWNTDLTNQTDPPSGQKDTGQVAGAPLDSSYFNWLLYTIYLWTVYVKNIGAEILTWTALNTFTGGIVVTRGGGAGDAVLATGGTGAGSAAVKGTANAGGGGYGGYFDGLTGIGVVGIGAIGVSASGTLYGVGATASGGAVAAVSGYHAGAGLGGKFESTTGIAISAIGGTDQDAGVFTANGTGRGGLFTGGESGAGIRALGGTGGVGVSNMGGQFVGGSPTIGTGSVGVYAIGGAAAAGGLFEAGLGSAPGLIATGGTSGSGGPGIRANNGVGTVGPAIDCRGQVDFLNATAPAYSVPLSSKLTRNSFAKAWVLIQCNGTATPTILGGQNVASVAQSTGGGTNGEITVTLASAMASTDYAVVPLFQNVIGGDRPLCYPKTFTSSSVFILEGQTTAGVIMTATAWDTRRIYIEINGAS